jgi:RNA polymerase sigma-70 factor, ECF subfamily
MSDDAPQSQEPVSADDLDVALMRRVRGGDMGAFEQIVETHKSRVVGTVAKMLGDDRDSEDIAQHVFIRVWKSAARYEPSAKFTTWLMTITRNLVFNEVRRRKRHPASALEHEEEAHHFQARDVSSKAPDEAALDAEMQQAIQRAIDGLPEVQRMAIVLRRYDEMPYEEIGVVLKLSVPAVKSVIFRARQELRERLKKYLEA